MLVKESDSEYNGQPSHLFACDVCGTHFHRGGATLRAKNHFCSVPCRNEFQATKKNRRSFECPHCGNTFERVAAHVHVENPFCSRKCAMSYRMKKQWEDNSFRKKMVAGAQAQWTPEKKEIQRESMTGETNPVWKGGRTTSKGPYPAVRCPQEFQQMAQKNGYVLEHRLVMARSLGRPLLATEVVHHKNCNVLDSQIENLELFPSHADHLARTTGKHL